MEDLCIRKVRKEDNERLARVIRAAFEEHQAPLSGTVYSDPTTDKLFELFCEKRSVLWVVEADNKILGCCGVYPTSGLEHNCAELVKFYILEDVRGRGVGKALLSKCMQSASEFGYKRLYLESLPHFARAVKLYEKSGFTTLVSPMGNSGHTSCNIWMIREI